MQPSQPTAKPSASHIDWLIDELTLLAISKGSPQTPERLAANAADLSDISQETMRDVFSRARREPTFGYPQVSDLRRMAGVQPEQSGVLDSDKEWVWLVEYIQQHGATGNSRGVYANPEADRQNCERCHGSSFVMITAETPRGPRQVATRCDCSKVKLVPAPPIPPRVRYALLQIGTSVVDALQRVFDCEPQYQGVLRKEFSEAYSRALELERNGHLLEAVREPEYLREPMALPQAKQDQSEECGQQRHGQGHASVEEQQQFYRDLKAIAEQSWEGRQKKPGEAEPRILPPERLLCPDLSDEEFEARKRQVQEQALVIEEKQKAAAQ